MAATLLLVIERGYRGAAEVQFSDLLYVARGLHNQYRGADLVLRGDATSFAVDAPPVPSLCLGERELDALPDPRRSVRELVQDGLTVWVDEPDLRALDLAPERLIPGVLLADTDRLTAKWPQYQGVWYL